MKLISQDAIDANLVQWPSHLDMNNCLLSIILADKPKRIHFA